MRPLGVRAHPLVFGVVVFLASESMLFAGLLAAWYDLRGQSTMWIPQGAQLDFAGAAFGTALLGAGSVTMGVAQWAAAKGRRGVARGMLVLTIFCALSFAFIALRGWHEANFAVNTNAFGTLYFVMTGVHLAHVFAGAAILFALTMFLGRPAFTGDDHAGVEAIAYYWHFVFIVWVGLWATIYLVR
jgi:heme/copper-type cytochrome/quinol oxidase subunit 3